MSARPIPNNPMNSLERMFRAMEIFKATEPKPSVLMVQTFLVIAANPDDTLAQRDVATALGKVPAPMVHEAVGRLGTDTSPRFGKALGLVDIHTDAHDARVLRLRLTRKGRDLASAMAHALRGRET
jgi:hypothetical protein